LAVTLDRSSPPRRIVQNGDEVSFAGSELVFRELTGKANYLARIGKDGTELVRIVDTPILNKHDTSPDGSWVVAVDSGTAEQTSPTTSVRSVRGGAAATLCLANCGAMFSPDGKWLYVSLLRIGNQPDVGARTLAIPMGKSGEPPDSLPAII
jgi:hypothetical protein